MILTDCMINNYIRSVYRDVDDISISCCYTNLVYPDINFIIYKISIVEWFIKMSDKKIDNLIK